MSWPRDVALWLATDEGNELLTSCDSVIHILDVTEYEPGELQETFFDNWINVYFPDKLMEERDENWSDEMFSLTPLIEWKERFHFWHFITRYIEKEYWFFRALIDDGISDEAIIKIGKILFASEYNNLEKLMKKSEELLTEINNVMIEEKWEDYFEDNYEWEFFFKPKSNLIDWIRNVIRERDEVILIWGGETECLKEIELLIRILYDDVTVEISEYVY